MSTTVIENAVSCTPQPLETPRHDVIKVTSCTLRCAVRQLDRRQPSGGPAVLVYVRSHGGNRMMELNSICSPAQRPDLFAVGGGDPWLRVFDRRVTSSVGRVKVCVVMFVVSHDLSAFSHATRVYGSSLGEIPWRRSQSWHFLTCSLYKEEAQLPPV